jgi:hypothetical protein
MPGINPSLSMWLNIVATVLAALTGSAAMFTDLFGQGPAQKIMAGIGLAGVVFGAINTTLHANSSAQAGPAVK